MDMVTANFLSDKNIGVYQAIQFMTSGAVTESEAEKLHLNGRAYRNILIGTDRK